MSVARPRERIILDDIGQGGDAAAPQRQRLRDRAAAPGLTRSAFSVFEAAFPRLFSSTLSPVVVFYRRSRRNVCPA